MGSTRSPRNPIRWIETEVGSPLHNLEVITRLNGREGDRGSTSGMTYDCYDIVSGISKYVTPRPGDIILTGAPGFVEQIRPGFYSQLYGGLDMNIALQLHCDQQVKSLLFEYDRMINAGYVGRNQDEVQRHIAELAEKGIPAPKTTPILIPVFSNMLTSGSDIEVFGRETSGEVEYVLFVKDENEIYVGLGSDHTDRHLEEVDIPRSKQICPNVICSDVWRLSDVAAHWDSLILQSDSIKDGKQTPYQEGRLGLILSPMDLIRFVRSMIQRPLENMVIFSGTIATLTGEFNFGEQFSAELLDETLGRCLKISYRVKVLKALSEF